MQLAKRGLRIEVCKQRRMKPFGQLLDGHELIGAVVELVPDGVEGLAVLRLDSGIGRATGVPGVVSENGK